MMSGVADPFAALGVHPGVSERDLAAAYRQLAKRWHPDHAGEDEEAAARMAALNEAYAMARAQLALAARARPADPVVTRRPAPGVWLGHDTRNALGWELLTALNEGERIEAIAKAGGPGRGPIRLVIAEYRLLWLLEDAVTARVDWVRFGLIERAEIRRPLLGRRRGVVLRLRTRTGRRHAFGDLDPVVAERIVARAKGLR